MKHIKKISKLTAFILTLSLTLGSLTVRGAAYYDTVGHWAEDYILYATHRGFIALTSPTTFEPDKSITRAEFAYALAIMAGARTDIYRRSSFSDISANNFYMPYIEWAAQADIVRGWKGEFSPSRNITREEMATMVLRCMNYLNLGPVGAWMTHLTYDDIDEINDWAFDAVVYCYSEDIMRGYDGRFHPKQTISRAQIAAILQRLDKGILDRSFDIASTRDENQTAENKPTQQSISHPNPDTSPISTHNEPNANYAELMLLLINAERAKLGASPLVLDASINRAAEIRAEEISRHWSHDRPNGSSCFTIFTELSIQSSPKGENIAAGNVSYEATFNQWLNSPGHYNNMMNPSSTKIGIGYYQTTDGYKHYWVQLFASDRDNVTTKEPNHETNQETKLNTEQDSNNNFASEMLLLINAERAKVGVRPLVLDADINRAAMFRAEEITRHFSHDRPDGSLFITVFNDLGIQGWASGENIAAGNASVQATFNQWLNSPGHYSNMIHPDYSKIGIGYFYITSGYNHYWVQLFY